MSLPVANALSAITLALALVTTVGLSALRLLPRAHRLPLRRRSAALLGLRVLLLLSVATAAATTLVRIRSVAGL